MGMRNEMLHQGKEEDSSDILKVIRDKAFNNGVPVPNSELQMS